MDKSDHHTAWNIRWLCSARFTVETDKHEFQKDQFYGPN